MPLHHAVHDAGGAGDRHAQQLRDPAHGHRSVHLEQRHHVELGEAEPASAATRRASATGPWASTTVSSSSRPSVRVRARSDAASPTCHIDNLHQPNECRGPTAREEPCLTGAWPHAMHPAAGQSTRRLAASRDARVPGCRRSAGLMRLRRGPRPARARPQRDGPAPGARHRRGLVGAVSAPSAATRCSRSARASPRRPSGCSSRMAVCHSTTAWWTCSPTTSPRRSATGSRRLRVRHLLSMSTGHAVDGLDTVSGGGWLGASPPRGPGRARARAPGSCTRPVPRTCSSAIATRITGERLLDHLTPRLLAPLGIDGRDVGAGPRRHRRGWLRAGHDHRGRRRVRSAAAPARQLAGAPARVRGVGRRPPPHAHVSNGDPAAASDWTQGYGFQFWRGRHGSFRADGAFGQLCVVLPEQEAGRGGHGRACRTCRPR